MKKLFTIFLLAILLPMIFTAHDKRVTLEETKKQLQGDPYKIAEWIDKNMKTAREDIGYAQPPEKTFKYKRGDCEDFAILSRYFIGDKYETHLIVWIGKFRPDSKNYKKVKDRSISHCVLAIKVNRFYWGIIDQNRYIFGERTLVSIIKKNCDLRRVKIEKAYIMDLWKLRKKVIKKLDLGEE